MPLLYNETTCTSKRSCYYVRMDPITDDMAISEARANLTEVVNAVRLQDRTVRLSRRGTPQAAVVPVDVLDLIDAVGGLTAARELLAKETPA
jgi:prevent-host-death family protein